jgi:replicative DNA helicase
MTPGEEKAWLGRCLLIGNSTANWALRMPPEQEFKIAAHRKIYRVIWDLIRRGEFVNVVTVASELKNQRAYISPDYLIELTNSCDEKK